LSYDAEIWERCVLEAVFIDLYETLITEFDPHWKPMPSTAERLGVDQRAFRAAWTEAQDYVPTGRRGSSTAGQSGVRVWMSTCERTNGRD
jgi:hypothetical protein